MYIPGGTYIIALADSGEVIAVKAHMCDGTNQNGWKCVSEFSTDSSAVGTVDPWCQSRGYGISEGSTTIRTVARDVPGPHCGEQTLAASRPMNVISSVVFKTARIGSTSATFNNILRLAVLNLPQGAFADGICHNFTSFDCIVSFNAPNGATALSSSRSDVHPVDRTGDSDSHDWFINSANFQNVDLTATPKTGEMIINMHRRTTGAAQAPSINVTIAGDFGTGTFSRTETLTINCP